MSLETWVSVGTLLIAMLALATFLRSALVGLETRLGKRIDAVDTKIDTVETSLGKRIDMVAANVEKLDGRVYALAAGIKPLLESAEDKTTRATRRPA